MTLDYEKTKQDIVNRRHGILERQKAIAVDKAKLDEENQKLQQELIGLDTMMEGLNFMQPGAPPPDFEELGFGEKVEVILKQTPVHLFPTQIRDELIAKGTKGSSPKNLLISIHNVLGRIEKNLDIKEVDGRHCYKWRTTFDALASIVNVMTNPALAGLSQPHGSPNDTAVKAFLEGKRRAQQRSETKK